MRGPSHPAICKCLPASNKHGTVEVSTKKYAREYNRVHNVPGSTNSPKIDREQDRLQDPCTCGQNGYGTSLTLLVTIFKINTKTNIETFLLAPMCLFAPLLCPSAALMGLASPHSHHIPQCCPGFSSHCTTRTALFCSSHHG